MSRTKDRNTQEEQERILVLAERVKLMFGFCVDLIPDLDLLKRTVDGTADRYSMALSAAPILGAFGQDYEEIAFKNQLEHERAKALCNLIETLDRTEKERQEFVKNQGVKARGRADIVRMLGLG